MAVQFVLSQLSVFKDAESIEDYIGAYILSSFGSILLGVVLQYKDPSCGKACALKGAFYLSTAISILILAFISLSVLIQGPLGPSALIFASFIGVYFIFVPVGAIAGHIYCKFQEYRGVK